MLRWTGGAVASRDCKSCCLWQWDDNTNEIQLYRGGKRLPRRGPPLCWYGNSKCPKGIFQRPKTLFMMNEMALQHWYQCDAVGQFPDDPIVREHAGILNSMRQNIRDNREAEFHEVLKAIAISRA